MPTPPPTPPTPPTSVPAATNAPTPAATNAPVAPELAPRTLTRRVQIKDLAIGAGAPVAVQSMLSAPTEDAAACLAQIAELEAAGCEIVRVAIPSKRALDSFARVCEQSALPVVADIHFDYQLALAALSRGAAKLRINPGNIGGEFELDAVVEAAGEAGIPIRIGVNAGSLSADFSQRDDLSLPERLASSALDFAARAERRGFLDLVLSAKAHDVRTTVETYRILARRAPHLPLHLGVTEAGTFLQGTVKSAAGIGALLLDGIGDTLRVSLTDEPEREVAVAWELLAACGLRRRGPELVSCPTCGRCKVDLIGMAHELRQRLEGLDKSLVVALMGCVVNGPGEAASADLGAACGSHKGAIFSKGEVLYTVDEERIVDALLDEIERL